MTFKQNGVGGLASTTARTMRSLDDHSLEADFEAAIREIGGAIIAITLVMSAVFVPVGFMSCTVGIFYRQFSLTLAVAIVISGVNAPKSDWHSEIR